MLQELIFLLDILNRKLKYQQDINFGFMEHTICPYSVEYGKEIVSNFAFLYGE